VAYWSPVRVKAHRRNGRPVREHVRHLYKGGPSVRERELEEFERRYPGRGAEVYGATINKVRREQAAKRGGKLRERVRGHLARYPKRGGRRRSGKHRVRPHYAEVRA